jgi:hypothetical protein
MPGLEEVGTAVASGVAVASAMEIARIIGAAVPPPRGRTNGASQEILNNTRGVEQVPSGSGPVVEPVDKKAYYANSTEAMYLKKVNTPGLQQQSRAEKELAKTGKGAGEGPGSVPALSEDRKVWLKNMQNTLNSVAAGGVLNPLDPMEWATVAAASAGANIIGAGCAVVGCPPGLPTGHALHLQSALRELNRSEDKTHETGRKTGEQEPGATR